MSVFILNKIITAIQKKLSKVLTTQALKLKVSMARAQTKTPKTIIILTNTAKIIMKIIIIYITRILQAKM